MKRMWQAQEEKFISDNWPITDIHKFMEEFNKKFAARTLVSIRCKIDRMYVHEEKNHRSNNINETELEKQGKRHTQQIRKIADMFDLNKEIKIKLVPGIQNTHARFIEGKVVVKTDKLIILESKHYKESFPYIDFYTRRAVIV